MSDAYSNFISENGIHVHLIENTSGLFIGTTQANGWNSKSKTNQVFGHFHFSRAKGLIGLIQDNDQLDMITMDHTLTINKESGLKADKEVRIQVNGVHVNAMQTNSSVSIGTTQANQWNSKGKHNYGTGKLVGKSDLSSIMNNIDDRDAMDMYLAGSEKSFSVQSQVD